MGFLDNTTNNIILDAVLTDKGREFLARNDGSFSIYQFALSDDEVNYGWITKYGKTVGREKIIKNTPIFEASTNQNSSLKYKLLSSGNPSLTHLPSLKLIANSASLTVYANGGTGVVPTISFEQDNGEGGQIFTSFKDLQFTVEMNNLFVQLPGGNIHSIDRDNKATYKLQPSAVNTQNGSKSTFKVIAAPSLTSQMFEVYGKNNIIRTNIRITGVQSGATLDVPVYVNYMYYYTRS